MTVSLWFLAPGSWFHGAGDYFSTYIREGSIDMPDICKCKNESCRSKQECYRYISEPSQHQAYGSFSVSVGDDKCNCFVQAQVGLPLEEEAE